MPYQSDLNEASDAKIDRMLGAWRALAHIGWWSTVTASALIAALVYAGNVEPGCYLGAALVAVLGWPCAVGLRLLCQVQESEWQGERDKRTDKALRDEGLR